MHHIDTHKTALTISYLDKSLLYSVDKVKLPASVIKEKVVSEMLSKLGLHIYFFGHHP